MKLDPRFKDTEFTVEADSFTKHKLWQEFSMEALPFYSENLNTLGLNKEIQKRHDWKNDNMGTSMQIGEINKRPICVSFFWTTIDKHLIMFYNCTSQLADHKMVEDWLEKYCKTDNCNASNFHNCLHYINNANEQSLKNQNK